MKDQQIGLDCIDLINKKLSRKITSEEFYVALMEFHRKYPMEGHNPPLTPFQLKHYREIKEVLKDPHTGISYWDHFYPMNFYESGEMFIRFQQLLDETKPLLEVWKKREWPLMNNVKIKQYRIERLPYKDD